MATNQLASLPHLLIQDPSCCRGMAIMSSEEQKRCLSNQNGTTKLDCFSNYLITKCSAEMLQVSHVRVVVRGGVVAIIV